LVEADLQGIDLHGLDRLKPIYCDRMDQGILQPDTPIEIIKETDTTVLIDGNLGTGLYVGPHCIPQGTHASLKYNHNIQQYTLHAAILPFLQDGGGPYPEFQEAVQKHFDLKKARLQQQLAQWTAQNEQCRTYYNQCMDIWSRQEDAKRLSRQSQKKKRVSSLSQTTNAISNHTTAHVFREVGGVIEIGLDDSDDNDTLQQAIHTSLVDLSKKPNDISIENKSFFP
jgi:hypothetical protein